MLYKNVPIYRDAMSLTVKIVRMTEDLPQTEINRVIIRQVIRSATSIGANLAEGSLASSRREFVNFLQVSLKSAVETEHWLLLLERFNYEMALLAEVQRVIKILHTIVKKAKISN